MCHVQLHKRARKGEPHGRQWQNHSGYFSISFTSVSHFNLTERRMNAAWTETDGKLLIRERPEVQSTARHSTMLEKARKLACPPSLLTESGANKYPRLLSHWPEDEIGSYPFSLKTPQSGKDVKIGVHAFFFRVWNVFYILLKECCLSHQKCTSLQLNLYWHCEINLDVLIQDITSQNIHRLISVNKHVGWHYPVKPELRRWAVQRRVVFQSSEGES